MNPTHVLSCVFFFIIFFFIRDFVCIGNLFTAQQGLSAARNNFVKMSVSVVLHQVAQTWQILKLLYSNSLTFTPTFGTQQSRSMSLTPQTIEKQDMERCKYYGMGRRGM